MSPDIRRNGNNLQQYALTLPVAAFERGGYTLAPDYSDLRTISGLPIWQLAGPGLAHFTHERYSGKGRELLEALSVNGTGCVTERKVKEGRRSKLHIVEIAGEMDSRQLIATINGLKTKVGSGGLLMILVTKPDSDLVAHMGKPCSDLVDCKSTGLPFVRTLMVSIDGGKLLMVGRRGGGKEAELRKSDLKGMAAMRDRSEKTVIALSCGCVVCLDGQNRTNYCSSGKCEFNSLAVVAKLPLRTSSVSLGGQFSGLGEPPAETDDLLEVGRRWLEHNQIDSRYAFRRELGERIMVDPLSSEGQRICLGDDEAEVGKVYEMWEDGCVRARYICLGLNIPGTNKFKPALVRIFPEPQKPKRR